MESGRHLKHQRLLAECWRECWLFCFRSSFLLTQLEVQMKTQVLGFLLLTWDAHVGRWLLAVPALAMVGI